MGWDQESTTCREEGSIRNQPWINDNVKDESIF